MGPPQRLADLRGRAVLLHFWTAGCVNCLHALAELRPLAARFGDRLVVVGVSSPKFPHETAPGALVSAVARLGMDTPVLDDGDHETWSQYAVRAWPTLVVVDPQGYVAHVATGEGRAEELTRVIAELVGPPGPEPLAEPSPSAPPPAGLTFPTAVVRLPGGTLLVSDTGADRLVELAPDARTVLRRVDAGGLRAPRGLLVDGGSVLVADAGSHRVLRVDLATGAVTVEAGSGQRRRPGDPTAGPAREVPLSSPSAVARYEGALVVAGAGTHQLWAVRDGAVHRLAGTGAEQLRDGPAARAYLAQPSGLAVGPDRLWFVDAESSALRWYRAGEVGTAVGSGLFAFGADDGPAEGALLQHPLGVVVLDDGSVAVLDTYNGAVRRYDPVTGVVSTLARGLAEPTGGALCDGGLLVVERAAGRLTRLGLGGACTP